MLPANALENECSSAYRHGDDLSSSAKQASEKRVTDQNGVTKFFCAALACLLIWAAPNAIAAIDAENLSAMS
jgi:hypothetical protein